MLERKTPLKRAGQLARRVPLRKVGKKGRRDRREMDAVRPEVLARGCEFYIYANPCMKPDRLPDDWRSCAGPLDPHHARKKGQGGSNEPSNLICLCRRHHDFTEDEPALSREMGLLR